MKKVTGPWTKCCVPFGSRSYGRSVMESVKSFLGPRASLLLNPQSGKQNLQP